MVMGTPMSSALLSPILSISISGCDDGTGYPRMMAVVVMCRHGISRVMRLRTNFGGGGMC